MNHYLIYNSFWIFICIYMNDFFLLEKSFLLIRSFDIVTTKPNFDETLYTRYTLYRGS